MSTNSWTVSSTSDSKTLNTIINEIDSALKGGSGINLDPEYQREYKFTTEDESLLIESILMDIPIPVIYLSSDIRKQPYVANVIDGQHRLRAVYRYLNNKFLLTGLKFYSQFNNKSFNQLDSQIQNKLLHQSKLHFENIHVQNNPSIEIEIFKRYNKGTHPLSKQEFRNAVYGSELNLWLNDKLKLYFANPTFKDIYNISKKRYADKSAHESICVMLCILYFGLNRELSTSPEYADYFMNFASQQDDQQKLIEQTDIYFLVVNNFFTKIYNDLKIQYPFSKEIYGILSRNYKLQTPILMIISAFLHYLLRNEVDLINEDNFRKIISAIKQTLSESYLENDFKGSNTRPHILKETVDVMIKCYEDINYDNSSQTSDPTN
ncbi:MAG: DUF262 domain-containing protein [Candidatus Pristimantibacillus sp.]